MGLRSGSGLLGYWASLAALGAVLLVFAFTPSAQAAAPDLLWQSPEDGLAGAVGGRVEGGAGIGVDGANGHFFLAEQGNSRVSEFNAWGQFVKAWGWGVVASGPDNKPPRNEEQRLAVTATSGSYRLRYFNAFGGGKSFEQKTVTIASDATPAAVQDALEGLESLAPGDVAVGGSTGEYTISFQGDYVDADIPQLEVVESTLGGGGATIQTIQSGGSFEVCIAGEDVCQAGQSGGSAPGELASPTGVAIDAADDVYVSQLVTGNAGEEEDFRVQKFSPAGNFELMFGGEVNKTKTAEEGSTEAERNLCTKEQLEAGDICGAGVPGLGNGQFAFVGASFAGNRIVVGPDGGVYVGDVGRIQRFSTAGVYEASITGEIGVEKIKVMAMDNAGNFYVTFAGKDGVQKLSPNGMKVTPGFAAKEPGALALDAAGNLYVVSHPGALPGLEDRVLAYDKDGNKLIPDKAEAEAEEEARHKAEERSQPFLWPQFAKTGGKIGGLAISEACGLESPDLVASYNSFLRTYGPAPRDTGLCPPPLRPPTIVDQFATVVGSDAATVRAKINPRFWSDTRYYVEYGTGSCASGGCARSQPLPPGSLLTGVVVNAPLQGVGVLSGLEPDTTYHYRFVAESHGGGPVFGVDPDGEGPEQPSEALGLEGSFKTFLERPAPPNPDPCANATFRGGASAPLSDCRAYEMVSPVSKNSGDIVVVENATTDSRIALNQSSASGERLAYSSYRSFGDAQSAPFSSTYLASRGEDGWSSHGISPSRGTGLWEVAAAAETQFKAFSPDLCESWIVHEADPPLAAGAVAGFANLYRRNDCGAAADSYEALTAVEPPNRAPKEFRPEVQGVSADGRHVIFRVTDRFDGGPDLGNETPLLYESPAPGSVPRLVCVLPSGAPTASGCSAGTATGTNLNDGRTHTVSNAISGDGSLIYWTNAPNGPGKIYLRINGQDPTLSVSEAGEALSGTPGVGAQYWTAAADGSSALYTVGALSGGEADLYRYRVVGTSTTKIAGKVYGMLGASEDAGRIYLVSGEALDGAAAAGKPNLYLFDGSFHFITTLSRSDVSSALGQDSATNPSPLWHLSRVTPDGLRVTFMSSARLTGYDNTDVANGEADAEIYLYGADDGLHCISCNPTGARPTGRDIGWRGNPFWAAGRIATSQTQAYETPRVLLDDGSRLYFESFEALVPADTNGKQDVYQWEAPGQGPAAARCSESSPSYSEEAGGCIDLISSGESDQDSDFIDASADGRDVFFATVESLLPQDPELFDIYDAREGGGFPIPAAPKPPCEGEACQSPAGAPAAPSPASSTFRGPVNLKAKSQKRRCPKGRRRVHRGGKAHCVKKERKRARHVRRPHHRRRAAR
jgi:hypothetical protein